MTANLSEVYIMRDIPSPSRLIGSHTAVRFRQWDELYRWEVKMQALSY